MTRYLTFEQLVTCAEGDRDLVLLLVRESVIERRAAGFAMGDLDRVLAARTLMRELEVNVAGIDIILRLREQLASARRRIAELEKKR